MEEAVLMALLSHLNICTHQSFISFLEFLHGDPKESKHILAVLRTERSEHCFRDYFLGTVLTGGGSLWSWIHRFISSSV